MSRFWAWIRTLARSPLGWILAACAILRVIGIGWGLPASDGWDNDGVAPRDFLAGLVETFTPGHYFTYPPVHLLILGVLTLPVTVVALVNAHSLAPNDVIAEILNVSYMTWIATIARLTTVVMSLGITYAMAKIAEVVRGPRAAWCTAAVCGVDMSFTYYAHTTNLDIPYLFWASLSLLALVRTIAWHEPRRLRIVAIFAVLAVATKDQAYALFLASGPLAIAAWFGFVPAARKDARTIFRELLRAAGIGALILLVADAIIVNPTGFRERLRFLVGPASRDFAAYARDWTGRMRVLADTGQLLSHSWPSALLALAAGGLVLHLWRRSDDDEARARKIAGLVPLLWAISFTVAFNWVALRVEHRFVLPQSLALSVYAGIGTHALLFELRGKVSRIAAQAALALAFARGLFMTLNVDVTLLYDPRYDAERWMREHVAPGDKVETYGLNVYLPRFPKQAHVTRVGPEPAGRRNPMPGFEEVQDGFENVAQRKPKWIVLANGWAWRYLIPADASKNDDPGKVIPDTQITTRGDALMTTFFRDLVEGRRGYRLEHMAAFESAIWPGVDLHGSTAPRVWILRANDP